MTTLHRKLGGRGWGQERGGSRTKPQPLFKATWCVCIEPYANLELGEPNGDWDPVVNMASGLDNLDPLFPFTGGFWFWLVNQKLPNPATRRRKKQFHAFKLIFAGGLWTL